MALRKHYAISSFSKDEYMGFAAAKAKTEMPSLTQENLFLINMNYIDSKNCDNAPEVSTKLAKEAYI